MFVVLVRMSFESRAFLFYVPPMLHDFLPDRIEAGTFLAMAAAMGDGVEIHNIIPEHLESFTAKLIEMGVD